MRATLFLLLFYDIGLREAIGHGIWRVDLGCEVGCVCYWDVVQATFFCCCIILDWEGKGLMIFLL